MDNVKAFDEVVENFIFRNPKLDLTKILLKLKLKQNRSYFSIMDNYLFGLGVSFNAENKFDSNNNHIGYEPYLSFRQNNIFNRET